MLTSKRQAKAALKKAGLFPDDIITARPKGMSYEKYRKERKRVAACLKDYLSVGRMTYVVSKGMYSKDPKTRKVFLFGVDTERNVEPSKRTLGIPYVNVEKREKREKELAEYRAKRRNASLMSDYYKKKYSFKRN